MNKQRIIGDLRNLLIEVRQQAIHAGRLPGNTEWSKRRGAFPCMFYRSWVRYACSLDNAIAFLEAAMTEGRQW